MVHYTLWLDLYKKNIYTLSPNASVMIFAIVLHFVNILIYLLPLPRPPNFFDKLALCG